MPWDDEEPAEQVSMADRAVYLRRLDRIRSLQIPQDTHWIELLSNLADGYEHFIEARCKQDLTQRELLMPTWSDLMMWAVLAGQHQMTRVLWQRARSPMRVALQAASLCARLATMVKSELQQNECVHVGLTCPPLTHARTHTHSHEL